MKELFRGGGETSVLRFGVDGLVVYVSKLLMFDSETVECVCV